MDTRATQMLPAWTPYFVGGLFVMLFASLCVWQLSRGLEKRERQRLFAADTSYTAWSEDLGAPPFQRLKAFGRYDAGHQILLENIVHNARPGFYVITPLLVGDSDAVLLVNRGWIEKRDGKPSLEDLAVTDTPLTVRGRAGSLPRAGIKMGVGILPGQEWPRFAVFPDADEVATALGREVYPTVLLLDPQEDNGFLRDWQPPRFGPGRHFGYAFQWFVMGAVLTGLLIRNYRRKEFEK